MFNFFKKKNNNNSEQEYITPPTLECWIIEWNSTGHGESFGDKWYMKINQKIFYTEEDARVLYDNLKKANSFLNNNNDSLNLKIYKSK